MLREWLFSIYCAATTAGLAYFLWSDPPPVPEQSCVVVPSNIGQELDRLQELPWPQDDYMAIQSFTPEHRLTQLIAIGPEITIWPDPPLVSEALSKRYGVWFRHTNCFVDE